MYVEARSSGDMGQLCMNFVKELASSPWEHPLHIHVSMSYVLFIHITIPI